MQTSWTQKLKRWWAGKQKEKQARPPFRGYAAAQSVGLFFDTNPAQEKRVKQLIKLFEGDGKRVATLCFHPARKIMVPDHFAWPYYARNHRNWWGVPSSPDLDHFLELDLDIFIDLTTKEHRSIPFVKEMANANLCLRIGKEEDPWADFSIVLPNDCSPEVLAKTLTHYLNLINA